MDKFFTQNFCDRCGCSLEGKARQMSRFNTDCLCLDCIEAEKARPDYKDAMDAELNAVKAGNYNFKGIGLK